MIVFDKMGALFKFEWSFSVKLSSGFQVCAELWGKVPQILLVFIRQPLFTRFETFQNLIAQVSTSKMGEKNGTKIGQKWSKVVNIHGHPNRD